MTRGANSLRRVRADGVVARDRFEQVEQLALVFVDPLDLHVEHRLRVDAQVQLIGDDARKRDLVAATRLSATRSCSEESSAMCGKALQRIDSRRAPRSPSSRANDLGQVRIALHQPAAKRDAVGLVGDAAGIDRIEVVEHGLAHQIGVQRRDAIDLVRADEGEIAHAHAPAGCSSISDTAASMPARRSRAFARCRDAPR